MATKKPTKTTKKPTHNSKTVAFAYVVAYGTDRVKAVVAVAKSQKAAEDHITKLKARRAKIFEENGVKKTKATFFILPVERID